MDARGQTPFPVPPATPRSDLANWTPQLGVSIGLQKHDASIGLNCSESQDFAVESCDTTRWKVCHAHDEPAEKSTFVIPLEHGRGRPAGAVRTEIDGQLVRGIPRLGEVVDRHDPPDAHLHLPEVVQRRRHIRIIDGMADVFHRPTNWEIVADKKMFRMTWDDGQLTEYEWDRLRRACPCAYCSGEGTFAGNVNADTKFSEQQTTLKEVYAVGRYGLTPEWADGHDTGIYTFKMLRRAAGLG